MLLYKFSMFYIRCQLFCLNTVMKAYQIIQWNSLNQIQDQTLEYVYANNLLDSNDFWNKVNTVEFVKKSPALIKFCQSLRLPLQECAILIAKDNTGVKLHVDEKPITAKLNIPILNTANTYTEWYDIPMPVLNDHIDVNPFGSEFINLKDLSIDNYIKIAELEMLDPVIFNSQIPHRVRFGSNVQLPRIVLACMFIHEPIDYLF